MNYKLISSVLLGILLCTSLSAMAKPTIQGHGGVVCLSRNCLECLLHCAKNGGPDVTFDSCRNEVCMDVCKIQEK